MTGDKMNSIFIIATLVFLCVSQSHGLRILGLFPYQIKSHFIMCEELMRVLATKGHQVDVYSHFPLTESVKNYRDYSLEAMIPASVNNMTAGDVLKESVEEFMEFVLSTFQADVCGLLGQPIFQKLLREPPVDPPYDLVITELSVINCFIPFGRLLNLPVIGVVTLPLLDWQFDGFKTPLNLATDPSLWTPYAGAMTFFERLDNFVMHFRVNRCFRMYSKPQDEYVEKYFGPGLPNVIDLMKDVSLVLVNYDQALYGMRPFAPKVIPVGGLHIVDRNETLPQIVQKWLDESKDGCVYFSFGSMTRIETLPRALIETFYQSFKNISPVRVLLKIAKPEELPPGLPSNVLTQPWLQQIQVLKHANVKAFVTHGGVGSTQESVYYGVPMVGVPLFGDQHSNIQAYVERKIAVKVELREINEETFTKALKEILYNQKYRNSMKRMSEKFKDHPQTPMDTAVYWIEYIHRYGKDALKSPAEDLFWWQASLYDVYAFLGAIILSSLCLIFLIVRKMYNVFLTLVCSHKGKKVKRN